MSSLDARTCRLELNIQQHATMSDAVTAETLFTMSDAVTAETLLHRAKQAKRNNEAQRKRKREEKFKSPELVQLVNKKLLAAAEQEQFGTSILWEALGIYDPSTEDLAEMCALFPSLGVTWYQNASGKDGIMVSWYTVKKQ